MTTELRELNFQQHETILNSSALTKAQIIELILSEANEEKEELLKDIKTLEQDKAGIEGVLSEWESKAAEYEQRAQKIYEKHQQSAEQISRLGQQSDVLNEEIKNERAAVNDLNEIKKGLQEQVLKEFKGIDKKNLATVTRTVLSNGDEVVGHFLLNSLTQFFLGRADTTFANDGQELFATVEALDTNLRKVDHLKLEKKVIEEIMQKITGESGRPEEGEIYQKISQNNMVAHYIAFYPFFRVLSKLCHLAFIKRKEAAHIRK